MKRVKVSNNVIRRLPRYLRKLDELDEAGVSRISSGELGRQMGLTPSQIRQDFSCFGEFGQQGYGYNVKTLLYEISEILGISQQKSAIIVGCGNLGRAITAHLDFAACGIYLMGAFDADPALAGTQVGEIIVSPVEEMESFVCSCHPHIAVLTLPGEFVQDVANDLASWGVTTFWNLAGKEIFFSDPNINVENTSLLDSLLTLSYRLKEKENR